MLSTVVAQLEKGGSDLTEVALLLVRLLNWNGFLNPKQKNLPTQATQTEAQAVIAVRKALRKMRNLRSNM